MRLIDGREAGRYFNIPEVESIFQNPHLFDRLRRLGWGHRQCSQLQQEILSVGNHSKHFSCKHPLVRKFAVKRRAAKTVQDTIRLHHGALHERVAIHFVCCLKSTYQIPGGNAGFGAHGADEHLNMSWQQERFIALKQDHMGTVN